MRVRDVAYENDAYEFEKDTHMVQVCFGTQKLRYLVGRNLLTAPSPVLKRATAATSISDNELTVINLSGRSKERPYFKYYVNWLYTREIKTRDKARSDYQDVRAGDLEYFNVAKLYLLGQLLGDPKFCEVVLVTVVERIIMVEESFFTYRFAQHVITATCGDIKTGDAARNMLVFRFVSKQQLATLKDGLPTGLLSDVVMELIDNRPEIASVLPLEACDFHSHAPREACGGSRKRKAEVIEVD